jgi:hypothetical protein
MLDRTEFLTPTIRASPGWKAQTISQSGMRSSMSACCCVLKQRLDTADIVRRLHSLTGKGILASFAKRGQCLGCGRYLPARISAA